MPEGDTIFRAARTLNAALAGKLVTRFESMLPYLLRIDQDTPIRGRTVVQVESHGKWLLMHFSGDLEDGALGREIAREDHQAARRLDRLVHRMHDFLAGLVPGVIPQPSGVYAVLRAQEAGCAVLKST